MYNASRAFSMLEIVVTLVILTLTFLPLYRLFSYGTQGTVSTVNETAATSYASDLLELVKELTFQDLKVCLDENPGTTEGDFRVYSGDDAIKAFFQSGLDFYEQGAETHSINIEGAMGHLRPLAQLPPMLYRQPQEGESADELKVSDDDFKRIMRIKLYDNWESSLKQTSNPSVDAWPEMGFVKTAYVEVEVQFKRSQGGPEASIFLSSIVSDTL
ncbi:MAG: hypothetical protein GX221_06385 [Candidatus Riflebacteria bacterium]|nr:hypothetical protein [Candidatus Riflebacteria bacterium]